MTLKREWHWMALGLILLLSFYLRMQSLAPTSAGAYLFEFDPYYYTRITQFIVQGGVPDIDTLAWFPLSSTHKLDPPLTNYLAAAWYSLSHQGPFDPYALYQANAVFPPIFAALAALCAFFLILETTGDKRAGLVAAALLALEPRLIEKMAAGMQELTPFGIFGLLFFLAAYARVISREGRKEALCAGFALSILILGAKTELLAYAVLAGYMGLQGIIDYLKGKRLSQRFLEANAIVVALGTIASVSFAFLYAHSSFPFTALLPLAALAFYACLTFLSSQANRLRNLLILLLAGCVVMALLLTFSAGFAERFFYIAGETAPHDAVSNIIGEEGKAHAEDYTDAMGPLGIPFFALASFGLLPGAGAAIVLLTLAFSLALAWKSNSKWPVFYALILIPSLWGAFGKVKFLTQLIPAFSLACCAGLGSLPGKARRAGYLLALLILLMMFLKVLPILSASLSPVDCSTMPAKEDVFARSYSMTYYLYCNRINADWVDALEWMRLNTPEEARFAAWSDYGHWINYQGQRAVITRNDHVFVSMDMELAELMVSSTPAEAREVMKAHSADYLLLNKDLAEKWGALAYLYCVKENQTAFKPGIFEYSDCAFNLTYGFAQANRSIWHEGLASGELDGFTLVYSSANEEIKIFRIGGGET